MKSHHHFEAFTRLTHVVAVVACSLVLGACGGGGGGDSSPPRAQSVNATPQISGTPTTTVVVGTSYTFTPAASDADGDTLTFSIANAPSFATFNTSTGSLVVLPQAGDEGSYPDIVISVSDGQATASLPAFALQIVAPNTPPQISGSPATTLVAGMTYSFTPAASDADGDDLTFSIANAPSFTSFDTAIGTLVATPQSGDEGRYPDIVISVSDGQATAALAPFAFDVVAATPGNSAPIITGTPSTQATAGTPYSFRPTASDADGDSLVFSISNQPAWANFNGVTGVLTGVPQASDVGRYPNIVISVSDGELSDSLPAFEIEVVAAGGSTGSAELSWTPPTLNTDGSSLEDLAGYKIFYGPSSGNYTNQIQVNDPEATGYTIDDLPAGTWFFAVKAVSISGSESAYTDEISRVVGGN